MNHAQRKSLTSKIGTVMLALNPITENWEKGKVTGTYHREKIGDFDIGLVIDFRNHSSVEVNQKQIDDTVTYHNLSQYKSKNDYAYYDRTGKLQITEKQSRNSTPSDELRMIGYLRKIRPIHELDDYVRESISELI